MAGCKRRKKECHGRATKRREEEIQFSVDNALLTQPQKLVLSLLPRVASQPPP